MWPPLSLLCACIPRLQGSSAGAILGTKSVSAKLLCTVELDLLRPHWTHKNCGGIVFGCGKAFTCVTCRNTGPGIGAFIPPNTPNETEFLACHPELEVILLTSEQVTAHERAPHVLR